MNSDSDTPIDLTVANSPSQEDSTEIAQINRDSFDRNIKMTPAKKKKVSKPSVLPTFLPPCRVCNAKASGFHYGLNTCEGCKAFFKRSLKNGNSIKSCSKGGKCAENPNGKITCLGCRYERCVKMGMNAQGCKKGRYSAEMRTQHTNEFRLLQAEKVFLQNNSSNHCTEVAEVIISSFRRNYSELIYYDECREELCTRISDAIERVHVSLPLTVPIFSPGRNSLLMSWWDKFTNLLDGPATFNEAIMMLRRFWFAEIEEVTRKLALFAKTLDGFNQLPLDDKIILLKQARSDVIYMTGHSHLFPEFDSLVQYDVSTEDIVVTPRCLLKEILPGGYIDHLDRLMRRLLKFKYTLEDVAVLTAFLIFTPYREGLKQPKQIEKVQDDLLPVLEHTLRKNHPDQHNIVAETMLVLPELCESKEVSQHLQVIKGDVEKDLFPLMNEILK